MEPASPNAFLSEEPIQILKSGKFKDLPWLISLNKDEGLYPAAGELLNYSFLPTILLFMIDLNIGKVTLFHHILDNRAHFRHWVKLSIK